MKKIKEIIKYGIINWRNFWFLLSIFVTSYFAFHLEKVIFDIYPNLIIKVSSHNLILLATFLFVLFYLFSLFIQ